MALQPVYRLRAELKDYKPKIWRRFQIAGDATLDHLAYILMAMFRMDGSHLYAFTIKEGRRRRQFQRPSMWDDDFEEVENTADFQVKDLLREPGDKITFEYDFGDGWEVLIKMESIVEDEKSLKKGVPCVLSGRGYGILEDCGGPWGLAQVAAAFAAKKGDDYEEYREWLGYDDLDLTAFDLEQTNQDIKYAYNVFDSMYGIMD